MNFINGMNERKNYGSVIDHNSLNKNQNSLMPVYFQEILNWSSPNLMNNFYELQQTEVMISYDPPAALKASST